MVANYLNRLVPFTAIVFAAMVHFHYCEWAFASDLRNVPSKDFQRAIFFSHRPSDNVFVMAKSLAEKDRATKYGVYIPALIAVVSLASLKLTEAD